MKRVPAKTPRPWKEARGIKFHPQPAQPKSKLPLKSAAANADTAPKPDASAASAAQSNEAEA